MENNLVICIGELLIDFFCTDIDVDLKEGQLFQKQAGGAPANVTAAISKLGGQAAFIGKVGNDPFGAFLKQTLDRVQVDTSMMVMDGKAQTTLAFVSLKENGERDFVFHRGADALLRKDEIDAEKLANARILHFGSATALLSDPFCSTYFDLMETAKEKAQFISFDPNYRGDLWKNRIQEFIDKAKKAIGWSDFVKVSEEELTLITGTKNFEEGVSELHRLGARVVAVTLGKEGTLFSNGKQHSIIESISVKSIDSTGAGDAFVGAALYQLAKTGAPHETLHDFSQMTEIISFANKVGALVCTKMGAISALPTMEDVEKMEHTKS